MARTIASAARGDTTCLQWAGTGTGPILCVTDPQKLRLEFLSFGGGDNVVFVRQTSNTGGASTMEYDFLYGRYIMHDIHGACLELTGLPAGARVNVRDMSAGLLRVKDSAQATIFVKYIAEMSIIQVSNPSHLPTTGFFGMDYTCGVINIQDNADFVLADLYAESGPYMIKVSGDGNIAARDT